MKQKQSWEITNEFWEQAQPLIPQKERDSNKEYQRKAGGGRRPMEPRKTLEAVFYVLRTGIRWKALPKAFGSSSAVHRYFRFWCGQGFFQALWVTGLERYGEAKGVNWTWLGGGGCIPKAPLAQETAGKNPAGRGKKRKQTPYARRRRGSAVSGSGNRG
jgi:transposase